MLCRLVVKYVHLVEKSSVFPAPEISLDSFLESMYIFCNLRGEVEFLDRR